MKSLAKYPITLSGHVFYWENDKYFEVFEDGRREETTKEVFDRRSIDFNAHGTPFLIVDDKQVSLRLEVWKQAPKKIDLQRLQFYFDFSMITKDQFEFFNQLRAQNLA
ncbi:hypothetical protein [Paenibacillus sp. Y412MC10]|uniref:hypothetical protein n=1 Tax=Geobacillus sp. (strain Y412MC10) TaxID=481743 RepID=UPI0011AB3EC0|nr:hypothetical protein [Paenibacillus sp. Y412MC10]